MTSTQTRRAALLCLTSSLLLGGCATLLDSGHAPPHEAAATASVGAQDKASNVALSAPETLPLLASAPDTEGSAALESPASAAPTAANAKPDDIGDGIDNEIADGSPPAPVDPLRPEVRIVLKEREAQADLWERLRRGFAMPDLDTRLTRDREQWYASRPDYFQRMTERGGRYLFHIIEEVEKRGLPTELALLPFIESAFNPEAMSSARASGMWQFIPSTGKVYDLKQNVFRDDRRDVLASTRAALDYLEKLYGMFGDWHLALASYNWGEGSVARAVARNKAAGRPSGYVDLKMPRETQYYVPKLQAVKNLIARPQAFGLSLPDLPNHPSFLSVAIERDIDVELAAKLSGMALDDFKALNPQTNKPVILAAGTAQVLLPYDNANRFVRALPLHRGPLASWTAWVAPRTLRPSEAAKEVGMSETTLREVNLIPPHMLVKAGSTLLVARNPHRQADVSEHLADNASMALAPDGKALRKISLRAGRRDSVASVARRYRVSAELLAQWNAVRPGDRFRRGQTIVVFVPAKAGVASATQRSAASTKGPARKRAQIAPGRAVHLTAN